MYESVRAGWKQDKEYLGQGIAASVFDSNCLAGAKSYAKRKHL